MESIDNKFLILKVKFIAIFILISIFTYFILNYLEKENTKRYLNQTTQTYERAFNTIYDQYKDLADVVFTGFSRLGDLKNDMEKLPNLSQKEKNELRINIYNRLKGRYKSLKNKNIRSVNIILPDNTMFLKMNSPKKYDYKISEKRKIIKDIHQNKKPIDSYEIGINGAGFRFAYPIIENGKYLGVLSITFGAEAITSGIMKQYYVLSNFFINEHNFNMNLLEKKNYLFKKSHHKGFLYDMKVLKVLKKVTRKDMKVLKPSKKTTDKIWQNLKKDTAKSIYDNKIKMVFTTIPVIHKLTNDIEAYVTVRSKAEPLSIIEKNHLIIAVCIISLIGMIVFIIYQQSIKIIKEKIDLQKDREKDKQLLEQAKMAQMGEMIGNIAHQWRQPLSTISTAASGVKINKEFNILKDEELIPHMDIILDNVNYLSKTIDTFRDFIQEKNEKKELIVQDRVDETLNIVTASLNNNYIKVINEIDYENPIKIITLPGALSQVLMNLVNNAKDVMVEKNIDNRWIRIKMDIEDNKFIIISLEDNGGGVPDDIKSKIFNPYFTTKHESQGTGLGLYMSKEITKKHLNGELYVENTSNGAKFFIKIPLELS
jgi:signal transduction histidine kinase